MSGIEGETFGEFLKMLTLRRKITVLDLSRASGLTEAQIYRLRAGATRTRAKTIVQLAVALGLSDESPEYQRMFDLAGLRAISIKNYQDFRAVQGIGETEVSTSTKAPPVEDHYLDAFASGLECFARGLRLLVQVKRSKEQGHDSND